MTKFHNDSLDNLFTGDTGPVRTAPVLQREAAQAYTTTSVELFTEPCKKCRGTGKFTGWSGRQFGDCFACKGAGKFTFKTSPESRAAAADQRTARKDRVAADAMVTFAAAQPQIHAWLKAETAKEQPFAFAVSMVEAIVRYGDLTAGQLAACQRLADKAAAKVAARVEAIQNAPQVDTAGIDRLKAAFDNAVRFTAAKAKGLTLRNPKITIGGLTISPAKATSKNPGALYVKDSGVYIGKIAGGRFFAANANGSDAAAKVQEFIADPAKAAKAYGQETGVCCVCNATLKSAWRLRGIGPVCAEKMGWAGEE